jgi:hypothetical protein
MLKRSPKNGLLKTLGAEPCTSKKS